VTRDPAHLVLPAIAAFSVAILPTDLLVDQDLMANVLIQDVILPRDQLVDLVLTVSAHTHDATLPTGQLVDHVLTVSVLIQDVTHPTVQPEDLVQTANAHTQDATLPTDQLVDQDQTASVHTQDVILLTVSAMELAAIRSVKSRLRMSLVRDTSAKAMVLTDHPGELSVHLGMILLLGRLKISLRVAMAVLARPHRIGSL
jgi:hypothetical protein